MGTAILETLAAHRLQRLEREECTLCLLYRVCALMAKMETEEDGSLYDAVAPEGKCIIKKQLQNLPDKEIGDYYLIRHWED